MCRAERNTPRMRRGMPCSRFLQFYSTIDMSSAFTCRHKRLLPLYKVIIYHRGRSGRVMTTTLYIQHFFLHKYFEFFCPILLYIYLPHTSPNSVGTHVTTALSRGLPFCICATTVQLEVLVRLHDWLEYQRVWLGLPAFLLHTSARDGKCIYGTFPKNHPTPSTLRNDLIGGN